MARNPNILVTGGRGFIGKALCYELSNINFIFDSPNREILDLTSREKVASKYPEGIFDHVFHLASTGVFLNPNDCSIVENELNMVNALLPLVKAGGKFLYAGSMAEYGLSGILSENDICSPAVAYQRAKYDAGQWIYKEAQKHKVIPIVTRIFGVYGPGESSKRLLPSVLNSLRGHNKIMLSDCLQIRDFVHVSDVANIFISLMRIVNSPIVVNIGTGIGLCIRDVLLNLCEEIGEDPSLLAFGARLRSPLDQSVLVANTTRLKETIGYVPPQRLLDKGNYLSLIENGFLYKSKNSLLHK